MLFMFKVKYVHSIMMLVRLDLNLILSLFQHKCEVSETVLTTTLHVVSTFTLLQVKMSQPFFTGKSIVWYCPGWSK